MLKSKLSVAGKRAARQAISGTLARVDGQQQSCQGTLSNSKVADIDTRSIEKTTTLKLKRVVESHTVECICGVYLEAVADGRDKAMFC